MGFRVIDSASHMAVVVILILASLGFALVFLTGFVWAVRSGQFEDVETPSLRILADEPAAAPLSCAPTTQPNVTRS